MIWPAGMAGDLDPLQRREILVYLLPQLAQLHRERSDFGGQVNRLFLGDALQLVDLLLQFDQRFVEF